MFLKMFQPVSRQTARRSSHSRFERIQKTIGLVCHKVVANWARWTHWKQLSESWYTSGQERRRGGVLLHQRSRGAGFLARPRRTNMPSRTHQFYAIAFVENLPLKGLTIHYPEARVSPHELYIPLDEGAGVYIYPF